MRSKSERVSLQSASPFRDLGRDRRFRRPWRVRDACFLRTAKSGRFLRVTSAAPCSGAAKGTLTWRRLAKSLVHFSRTYGKNERRGRSRSRKSSPPPVTCSRYRHHQHRISGCAIAVDGAEDLPRCLWDHFHMLMEDGIHPRVDRTRRPRASAIGIRFRMRVARIPALLDTAGG